MGTKLKDLVVKEETSLAELSGKIFAVDSFNILFQFLSSIRQRDGSLLTDSKGNITSHLVGLFNRTTKLMQNNLKLIFVFDGKPPELKFREQKRRAEVKAEAKLKYEKAKEKEDVEAMAKFAARTSRLTAEMVEESKALVRALGLPVVQAPSEGEAQMAFIVNKGDAFAGISQDYDSLLYEVPKLVQNLTISERRKMPGRLAYETIKPCIIDLAATLNKLGIDKDQLIVIALLTGTDYNPGGVKGIGPKNALKLVKKYGDDFDDLFEDVKWDNCFDFPWTEPYYLIKKMPVTKDYSIKFKPINRKKIFELLVEEHNFSKERVEKALDKLKKVESKKQQKGLGEWT